MHILATLRIRGVVFDLDATLVDLGEHVRWREAQGEVIATYRACGCSDEDIQRCSGKGLFNLMHDMDTQLTSTRSDAEMKQIRESVWDILDGYEAEGVEKCGFMQGTLETLKWLNGQGVKMGVCTSNSGIVAEQVIEKLGVASYFDSVIGRTPGLRMKPYPDQVSACFKAMGVDARDGVMIGDSHNDVLAGRAAGAKTIAIPVYFTRKEAMEAARPDVVAKSMIDLPAALMSLR